MRFERAQAQKRRESRTLELPHPWTEEQLTAIEADILAEQPRGGSPRYWEDVATGDENDAAAACDRHIDYAEAFAKKIITRGF